jgi:hypothetical protein
MRGTRHDGNGIARCRFDSLPNHQADDRQNSQPDPTPGETGNQFLSFVLFSNLLSSCLVIHACSLLIGTQASIPMTPVFGKSLLNLELNIFLIVQSFLAYIHG